MDRIVYLITESGVDGRGIPRPVYASWDKTDAEEAFNNSKNKPYYTFGKQIVEVGPATKQVLAKLSALDQLLLGLPLKHPNKS